MQEREIFYENHPDPMWIFDRDTLVFLDVNKAAMETYGYTRAEFLALKVTDMRPPEDVPEFLERIRTVSTDEYLSRTFRHRKKSGEDFFVHITSLQVVWEGKPARLVSIRDVNRAVALEQEREALLRREEILRHAAEDAAEKLAEQNANLRTAQRLIGMGAWKFELWCRRLVWSPELFRMYGLDEANFDYSFDAYAALVHPGDRDAMAKHYEDFARSRGTHFDFAHRVLRPDGSVIHVRGVGEMTMTPQGRVLTGVVQDVTRQIEQDNRLRLLDLSVSRLNDIVVIFEAHRGLAATGAPVVYINAAFTRATGLTEADVLGWPILSVMAKAAPGIPGEVLANTLNAEASIRSDLRLFARDGLDIPAEIDLVPVRSSAGMMTHWVAVMRDMSDKQAADARARLNEERYQMVSRSTQDVLWDWDVRSGLLTWNENFRQLAGNPDALLTDWLTSWSDRLHAEDRDRVLHGFHGAIDGAGETWSDEYRFVRADGDVRFVFDRGFISRDETGRGLRIVGSMVDITRQKIADARLLQAEKLDALGQMTGGVAHDFNNLLTVIMGNTEALLDRTEDPRVRRQLELMLSAAERGRDLTGRLLAFARRMPLKPVALGADEQVQRCAELMRRTFRSNIRIETEWRASSACIQADPGQLELVLLNLAINARDAMLEGGVLTLATGLVPAGCLVPGFPQAEATDTERVVLSVTDTGSGMDAETLRRCLEPFFTTKAIGKGSGLGLSMAFGFMEQSGGRLFITSVAGRGTHVALLFPKSSQSVSAHADRMPGDRPMGGGEHVLVVEDDGDVREYLGRVLTELGYRVTALDRPDTAITFLREGGAADLILTDIIMPGSAGVRTMVEEAKAMLPEVLILYLSGYPREMISLDGRLSADIDLLSKPFRRSELALKVRELLDRAYKNDA